MKYIFQALGVLFRGLVKLRIIGVYGFAGIYLVISFFRDLINENISFALKNLIRAVGGSELVIRENVMLAINQPELYGFGHLLEIIGSFMVIYTVVKIIVWFGVKIGGGQAIGGLYLLSIPIIALMTFASGVMLDGVYFIPFYDSIIFLFRNISPVLTGALPSWLIKNTINQTATNISQNISINSTLS